MGRVCARDVLFLTPSPEFCFFICVIVKNASPVTEKLHPRTAPSQNSLCPPVPAPYRSRHSPSTKTSTRVSQFLYCPSCVLRPGCLIRKGPGNYKSVSQKPPSSSSPRLCTPQSSFTSPSMENPSRNVRGFSGQTLHSSL